MSENNKEVKKTIDAFLVDNQELEALTAKLSEFNLFNILKADKSELRHSNILAWLLDPKGEHGFSDRFLRRFISKLLMENENPEVDLGPAQVELMSLDDAVVYREWKHIDVLVKSEANKLCLLIENKIKSRESLGQLNRYKKIVMDEYPDFKVIPILLTLDGDDPSEAGSEAGFIGLSHGHVLELLVTLSQQYESRMTDDVKVFLDHYVKVLRRLLMQDEELSSLCKAIYRKHREAIDMIVQYGIENRVLDVCQETMENILECNTTVARGRVWFIPEEMKVCQEPQLSGWSFLEERYPIQWWFYHRKKNGKLQLTLEVGPMDDSEKRIALLSALRDGGFKIGEKGFRQEAKYTRISTITKPLKVNEEGGIEDEDKYVAKMVKDMWEKAWMENKSIVGLLSSFE
ncbi:PD-(D/E)XK nuclease family protein [Microbulbifer sp. MLAF003]|uniref:PDDEXK-like family protein n=1 Tax=Microbulbifer sp. MLAF003 TaxID=3032582 RepID=UPI0024AE4D8B|nr:PD-(D/E)XK nuclease family protein [Microbulbifer sp. MLAF003]WHI53109.1 PD-(D/E)XK nuclease family protein [Microbulbifer sp. MLAF003]